MTIKSVLVMLALSGACARRPIMTTTGTVPSSVFVHIDSNEPQAILARVADSAIATATGPGGTATAIGVGYDHICTVPCDVNVPVNQSYVFLGVSGLYGRSGTFVLPKQDKVTLRVDSGSQGAWILGLLGTIVGGTGALTGGALWSAGSAGNSDGLASTGEVLALVSLPVIVASIWVMAVNGTSVNTDGGEHLTRITPPKQHHGFGVAGNGVGWKF